MLNVWSAVGRMVGDADLSYLSTGKALAKFTLAVDNGKDASGEKQTLFAYCITWEKRAEFISNYGGKGRLVAVEGKWTQRSYEKDGQKRTVYEVQVNNINLLDKPKETEE